MDWPHKWKNPSEPSQTSEPSRVPTTNLITLPPDLTGHRTNSWENFYSYLFSIPLIPRAGTHQIIHLQKRKRGEIWGSFVLVPTSTWGLFSVSAVSAVRSSFLLFFIHRWSDKCCISFFFFLLLAHSVFFFPNRSIPTSWRRRRRQWKIKINTIRVPVGSFTWTSFWYRVQYVLMFDHLIFYIRSDQLRSNQNKSNQRYRYAQQYHHSSIVWACVFSVFDKESCWW